MDEGVGVLEVFRMLVIGTHDIRSVVLVCLAVLVGVWLVDGDVDVWQVAAGASYAVGEEVVDVGVVSCLLDAVGAYESLFYGVVVGVVELAFGDGCAHFVHHKLHGCERVS